MYMLGRKKCLEVGAIPREQSAEIAIMLEKMFDIHGAALFKLFVSYIGTFQSYFTCDKVIFHVQELLYKDL